MDNSVLGGGFLSGGSTTGILDLEPSIHRCEQHQHFARGPPPPPPARGQHNNHQMQVVGMLTGLDRDHSMAAPKDNPLNYGKGKGISAVTATATATATANKNAAANHTSNSNNNSSDDDELNFMEDGDAPNSSGAKGKKGSLWQRMKWTDNMVRLLVAVVSCVGDDSLAESIPEGVRRRLGASQRKGKWKTISQTMMEKGCYVSPQQCEDKFNDLNKRYKRLNDILGRGTSCRVVENPALLDSMGHLSSKVKDDVRKILSSKHLFYKEICAYHNGQKIPYSEEIDMQGNCPLPSIRCSKDCNVFDEEDDGDNGDCDDNDAENEDDANGGEAAERIADYGRRKKMNKVDSWSHAGGLDNFGAQMGCMPQDATKSAWEQQEWIRNRTLQLQEQRVSFQEQALELEKSRFRWRKVCGKKDRELDTLRLQNQRMRLENERMALQVKQKEMEVDFKRSGASTNPVTIGIDRLPGGDQIDLGRVL